MVKCWQEKQKQLKAWKKVSKQRIKNPALWYWQPALYKHSGNYIKKYNIYYPFGFVISNIFIIFGKYSISADIETPKLGNTEEHNLHLFSWIAQEGLNQ